MRFGPGAALDHARETLRHLPVVGVLVRRSVRARYQGTILGFGWTLVTPALLFAVYGLVFGVFFDTGVERYGLFLLSGLLPWLWLSQSIEDASDSLRESGRLLTRVALPPQTLPLAVIGAQGVSFVLTLSLLLIVAVAGGHVSWLGLLSLPAIVILQAGIVAGLALPAAALCTVFRDLRQLLGTAVRMLFFLTPIVYPLERVPESLRLGATLNPLHWLIDAYRSVFTLGEAPAPATWCVLVASAVASLAVGALVFEALRERAMEEL